MNQDDPFVETAESAAAETLAAQALEENGPASPMSAAGDEIEAASAPEPVEPKPAMKVKTKIEFDVTAEPYTPGQCTIILALAIRPDDGHPDGRLVVLGARSHDEAPVLATARLNTLQLPEPLTRLLADYEAQLPRRGALKAETRAKEEAEKKAAEERRQASRKGAATAKAKHSTTAKPETKPATTKPAAKAASTQVSLFGA